MKKNLVISSVAAIAALNPEGFTVNAATLQPVTTGYAVALKKTQNSFGAEGLAKVRKVEKLIEELSREDSYIQGFAMDHDLQQYPSVTSIWKCR